MDYPVLETKLQSEIEGLVSKNNDIFNAVLGITNARGDFSWSGAAGYAYADETEAMRVDTPIFIASITKMFTAAATMILEERGQLSLDDPIAMYLPESQIKGLHRCKGQDYSPQLNIYHLISQTSGLPDYFMDKPKGGQSVFDRLISEGDYAWDLNEVVDITKYKLSPKFPPEPKDQIKSSKRAHYSDTNYQLLGAIVEATAQKSLPEVFSELITEPLGLSSTYLHGYKDPQMKPESSPANIFYKTSVFHLDKAMKSSGPDGGLVSNVEDSLKFLRNFMEGKMFAERSTLDRMKNWKKIFFPLQYGLGLMRFKLPKIFSPFSPNPELVGHSGASSSFLFYSDIGQLYISGTLNQVEDQGRPFRMMLKMINLVGESLT